MPWSVIAAIATIASAGTAVGTTLYNAANQPSSTPPTPSTTPTPLTPSQNQGQVAAAGNTLPNAQALFGGDASTGYLTQFAAGNAGLSNDPQATGNIQQAINQWLGFNAPGNTGLTPTTTGSGGGGGPTDILSLLTRSNPANPASGTGSPAGSDFVSSILNSDTFKGLAA